VQKFADISPAFESTARRARAKAQAAEEAGELVTARANYFMAAVHYAARSGRSTRTTRRMSRSTIASASATRSTPSSLIIRVEAAWIPFQGKPCGLVSIFRTVIKGGRIPAVWTIPGMDGFKEANVALYGRPLPRARIAVLALEGPGQYESAVLAFRVSVPAWMAPAAR